MRKPILGYVESSAADRVARSGARITGKLIEVKGPVGIKTWGAIDYLTSTHGYVVVRGK